MLQPDDQCAPLHDRPPLHYPCAVEHITTAEAARRLDKSPSQVRRMVAAGRLRGVMAERPQGSRLVILWDDASNAPPNGARTAHAASDEASSRTVPRADYEWLQQRLEQSEQAQGELRRLLLAAHQTIETLRLQLPPPHEPSTMHDAPDDASVRPHEVPGDAASTRRPWWAFWRRA